MSVSEASTLAGVSRQTVHVWIRRHYVLAVWIGKSWRIERSSLERLVRLRSKALAAGVSLETARIWAGLVEPAPGEEEAVAGPRLRLAQLEEEREHGDVLGEDVMAEGQDTAEPADSEAALERDASDRGAQPR